MAYIDVWEISKIDFERFGKWNDVINVLKDNWLLLNNLFNLWKLSLSLYTNPSKTRSYDQYT